MLFKRAVRAPLLVDDLLCKRSGPAKRAPRLLKASSSRQNQSSPPPNVYQQGAVLLCGEGSAACFLPFPAASAYGEATRLISAVFLPPVLSGPGRLALPRLPDYNSRPVAAPPPPLISVARGEIALFLRALSSRKILCSRRRWCHPREEERRCKGGPPVKMGFPKAWRWRARCQERVRAGSVFRFQQ